MKKLYVNPLPVRIWHWVNVACFVALILSGLEVRYAGAWNVMSFRTAVVMHNWAGFAMIANFGLWLVFYLFSDKNRSYQPEFNLLKLARDSFLQARYYAWGMFRGERPRITWTRTTSSTRCSAPSIRS